MAETITSSPAGLSPAKRLLLERWKRGAAPSPSGPESAAIRRPREAGPLPLSSSQQRLWFLDQLSPGDSAYNLSSLLQLSGRLDLAVLSRAFREIVERHEILRTAFREENGVPAQVILPRPEIEIRCCDCRGLPGERRRAEMLERAQEQAARPFDLSRGATMRASLFQLDRDEHYLLVTLHHIVSDGWSFGIFLRELAALYDAFLEGAPSPLPPLPLQYADFAAWQQRRLAVGAFAPDLSYWVEHLRGAASSLELPADRPRPALQSSRGGSCETVIGAAATQALGAFATHQGVTLFMVCLAAFQTLLARYAGADDVLVGSPVGGRPTRDLEALIGLFANVVVMRGDLRGDPRWSELLERVRHATLETYEHQELPLEVLIDEIKPDRDLGRNPLFQVMLAFQNTPLPRIALPELTLRQEGLESQTSMFDLALSLRAREGVIAASLEFSADLFDPATARRILGHLQCLLAGACSEPWLRLSELPLLTAEERRQLLAWNDSAVPFRRDAGLHEMFAAQAAELPDVPAVVCGDEVLSYGELDRRSNQLARALRRLGVGPEVPVGLSAGRTPALATAMLGILKAGGVFLPLDPGYPRERLVAMAEDARIPVLLLAPAAAANAEGRGAPEDLSVPGAAILSLAADWESVAREDGAPLPPPGAGTSPENLAYIIYTSGSTGRPKGVACTHRGVVNLLADMERRRPVAPGEGCSLWTSISFDVSVYEIFSALCYGGALAIPAEEERTSGELLFPWFVRHRIRSAYIPAFLLAGFADWAEGGGPERRSLARLIVGVEPIPERLLVRLLSILPELTIVNGYGPTEATVCGTFYDVRRQPVADRRTPLGLPVANCQVYLLDAHLREVPVGVPGEVWIGGAGLARGYLDRPDLTAERFLPDPIGVPGAGPGARCYRTGDLARRLPDGYLVFLGRIDRQAKVRGVRIEPGEVEAALLLHPGVEAAAVTVRQDPRGEAQLVAYVVPRDAGADPAGASSWHELLAQRLPAAMLPAAYVPLSALPTTPNGKVDIRALPEPDWNLGRPRAAAVAPQDPIASLLAGIWSDLLHCGPVSLADDFFALGGHSLLATQIVSRVRQVFAIDLPLRVLFEARTLGAFARRVGELLTGGEAAGTVAAPTTGALPLSFAQQRIWFFEQLDPGSAAYHLPVALRARGTLDAGRLAGVLDAIVRRHETLRTRFVSLTGQPIQVIDPPALARLPRFPIVDLAALSEADRCAEGRRLRLAESGRPFDLERGPLLRSLLLRRADDDWDVLLTLHHIVSDGWSMGILLREVSLLYGSPSGHRELPELPIRYADFAVWQRRRLSGEVLERELAYWRGRLAGAPPLLELPADRPRGAAGEGRRRGGLLSIELGPELSSALAALAQQRAATLFMVLMAAFQSLLGRLSGTLDVCVGTPIAGRTRREVEDLIGLFVNTLVLRGDLAGDPPFAEHLMRVRSDALSAYAHQELPFERLVEELAPARRLDHTPLFQVFLALQNAPLGAIELPGVELSPLAPESGATRFDLELRWTETASGLVGALEYDASLFDRSTAARLAGQMESLLRAVAADPERHLSQLALLSAGETQQLLIEWGGVARETPPASVPARLSLQMARTPQAVAVLCGEESLTYGELDRRVARLARRLAALGVRPETRVGLLVERSLDLAVGLLAIWRARGAAVPLDPGQPRPRLARLIEDALPPSRLVLLSQRGLAGLIDELPTAGVPVAWMDEEDDEGEEGETRPDSSAVAEAGDLAYLIYTSGTTGRPKAVMVEHGSLAHTLAAVQEVFGITPQDRMPVVASASFDIFLFELLAPLLAGGTAVLFDLRPTLDLARLAEELSASTLLHTVPAVMRQLTARLLALGTPCRRLRRVFVGGDAVTADLLASMRRAFPAAGIVVLYGPTEATILASWEKGNPRPGSWIGRPLPGVTAEVRDDAFEAVPIGVAGELWLGGPGVARGYLGRPELTAERFVPDPRGTGGRLYRTGDRMRFDAAGHLEFLGRVDRQVKVRGYRIEPGEVEAALREHPGVREAAVVAARRGEDERLLAYVTGEDELASGELRRFVEARLPAAMVPRRIVRLDALPLTPHGKVDYRALAELGAAAGQETDDEAPSSLPAFSPGAADPVRETLAAIFALVLGRRGVAETDDFFALGGHSLLAMQVMARVREAFGVELPVRVLFEEPTPERLGRQVAALLAQDRAAAPPLVPVEGEADLPLSFAQQRLWFIAQLDPGSSAYHLPVALRARGRLDAGRLAGILDAVVRRHEALRTRFVARAGQPVQVIDPPDGERLPRLPIIDLAALPETHRQAEGRRLRLAESRRPFDLERGPLLRSRLLRRADDDWDVLLTLHHIVSDGWSMGVLLREVWLLYGNPHGDLQLPELPIRYADFAVWQRYRLSGEVLERELAYWRGHLAGALPLLELPADRPRGAAVQKRRSERLSIELGPELSSALAALARQRAATLFMVLMAAFQSLLGRLSGAPDVCVGTPIAGRTRRELEDLIGLFVNTLVLRGDLAGDPTFAEHLMRVRADALAAYAHQELPFERLVEELAPVRSLDHTPLFQVFLALQNAPLGAIELPGVELSLLAPEGSATKFDLELSWSETPSGLVGAMEYDASLFGRSTAARLAGQMESLLRAAAADPERRLSQLALLSAAEAQQLLVEWRGIPRETPPASVPARLSLQIARTPHAVAVVHGEESLTYGELDRRVTRLARRLAALGVRPETRVGLLVERSLDLAVGLLAIWRAHGAAVPLDPGQPRPRLARLIEDALPPGRSVLLSQRGLAGLIEELPAAGVPVAWMDEEGDEGDEGETRPDSSAVAGAGDLAYLIYTSGTTGRPKAVMVEHGSLAHTLAAVQEVFGLTPQDRMPVVASASFDIFLFELLAPLLAGGTAVLFDLRPTLDLARLADELPASTLLHTVPAVMRQLTARLLALGTPCPELQQVFVGGDAVAADLLASMRQAFPAAGIAVLYGPTEATILASWEGGEPRPGSWIGRPLPGVTAEVRDDAFEAVPIGVPGELWLGGPGVARGYLGRPELTAERFVPDPRGTGERLYRTGDRVRFDAAGHLEFLGRVDRQVKVRGYRIEPGEVEAALREAPGVREAAVLATRRGGDERLLAYVTGEGELASGELRRFVEARLPAAMVPGRFVQLDALPLTRNGKVDHRALAEIGAASQEKEEETPSSLAPLSPPSSRAAADPVRETLAAIFAAVLGRRRVAATDDFFALGGHSLLATQVMARVRETFGVEIPLRALFEEPSPERLGRQVAAALLAQGRAAAPPLVPVEREIDLPLSFAQQRLWFIEQLDPGSTAYHLPVALRARGRLDAGRLTGVLDAVVHRHESLRTRFVARAGQPVQVIDPPDGERLPWLPIVDLAALREPRREAEGRRLRFAESRRPFDLERGPLLRSLLLRRADDDWDVLLTMHHIVSDGWSMGVLLREVWLLYGAPSGELSLPELPIRYADFAAWQRRRLSGEVLERELAYWRAHLAGAPPLLELPADRPRGAAVQNRRSERLSIELGPDLSSALAALARQRAATLFMVLMAAFESLLGRLSGTLDVCVGTPIAGRTRRELEDLIGLFVNTLVLRGDLAGDPPFAEHLMRVRADALAAYAHQELPFERLVEELAPVRSLDHTPLFQVFLALQNAPLGAIELPGVELSLLAPEGGATKFDLELSWSETPSGLVGAMEYDASLFDRSTAARLAGQMESLLRAAAADSERHLSQLALLSAGETQQLLVEWRGIPRETPPASVPVRLSLQMARTPHAVAVVHGEESLTYGELDRRVTRLARRLAALGVRPETRVALLVERSLDLAVGLLAIWRAHGAAVPLDPGQPRPRLARLIEDALPPGHSALLSQRGLAGLIDELPAAGVPVAWMDEAGEAAPEPMPEIAPASFAPGHLAYLIYTSGTTGRPKAVMVEHGSLAHTLAAVQEVFGITPRDRMPVVASASFDIFLFELLAPLLAGGTAVLFDLRPTLDLARLAEELPASTLLHTVPAVMRQLTARLLALGTPCPELQQVFVGGDAVAADLLASMRQAFPAAGIAVLYGPTEATILASWEGGEPRPGSWIGRPLPGVTAEVRDDAFEAAPIGVAGELWLGGPGVARGYLGRPELTAERFVPDPRGTGERLYRTGDRVRFDAAGHLEFLGRVDRQVKVRGYRIEPGEVEAALREAPGVREAAVLATRRGGDERLLAYVTGESSLAGAELRRFVEARLPAAMVPGRIARLDALPLTPHGKVDYRALAELGAAAGEGEDEGSATPLAPLSPAADDPVRETLAAIFASVVGRERVAATDDFFELGGHSLLATQVIARVREAFGVELPVRALFEEPTPERLGRQVAALLAQGRTAAPPLVPVGREADLPLSFAQERLWFLQQLEPGSATYDISLELELSGRLDAGILAAALAAVVRRQESLRTTFASAAETLRQKIAPPPAAVLLPLADLSGLPEPARRSEVERLARQHGSRGFDLERGPLVAWLLVRLGGERHRFLLNLHHAIADGWSIALLARELGELYAAAVEGRPARLPELPIQYADFAAWQRRWLADGQEEELAYWESRLGGEVAAAELPTDRPRPALPTFRGGRRELALSPELTARLKRFGRAESATLFMSLLAATQALLARHSGEHDVAVGAPVAGRRQVETEGLIGCFLNTLVLRTDTSGRPSFRALVARVRTVTLEAYSHQDVPFEAVLGRLRLRRDLSRAPLFQVLFNLLNLPATTLALPGLDLRSLTPAEVPSKLDMTFYVSEVDAGVRMTLVYNADLFDEARMAEVLEQLRALLAQAVAEPEVPFEHLSLVTAAARAVLPDPAERLPEPPFPPIARLFLAREEAQPDRAALSWQDETWTYSRLGSRARQIAHQILALDGAGAAGAADRPVMAVVAVMGPRSPELVASLLGVFLAGRVLLTLDRTLPPARLRTMIEAARPSCLLDVGSTGAARPEERWLGELESLRVVRIASGRPAPELAEPLPADPLPDDPAYIFFTSGTSGRPKAVLGRQKGLGHFLTWESAAFGIGPGDRIAQLTGLSFDAVLRDVFLALTSGATLHLPDEDDLSPERLLPWLAEREITVLHTVPSLASAWLGGAAPELRSDALRRTFFVGEPLLGQLVESWRARFSHTSVVNLYGATETTLAKCFYRVPDTPSPHVQPAGGPMPQTQALVLAATGGRGNGAAAAGGGEARERFPLCGLGEVGEIVLRTPFRSLGYLDNPEENRFRFRPNPFRDDADDLLYFTGDRGRYRLDGILEVLGRLDEQVKIRGVRIEPAEIRVALSRHAAVRESAVVLREGRPGDDGDHRLVAYVVLRPGAVLDAEALRRHLRQELPEAMVPTAYVAMDALPLTANGKLDVRRLPAPPEPASAGGERRAPGTPVEETLAAIWQKVLGLAAVGADDNFFDLGGHSLLATRIVSQVRSTFHVELRLHELFEAPTVASLARRIEEAVRAVAPAPGPARRASDLPLSFAQERLWFIDRLQPGNPAYNLPLALDCEGALDAAALARTLAALAARHETLRTRFAVVDGGPVQRVDPPGDPLDALALPAIDLAALPAARRDEEETRLLAAESWRPFDLDGGPLARARLLRLAADRHAVLLVLHHSIADGWSLGVLVRDLSTLYREALGEAPGGWLPELPMQYADYAVWQRTWFTGEVLERELAYWRERLAGAPPLLALPTDRPRPPLQSWHGAMRPIRLGAALSSSLQGLARRMGATPFMVLAAGFLTLLGRYSNQDDVTLGMPIAGRTRAETEDLVGFFVNTLVLRAALPGGLAFEGLVERVRADSLAAYEHQEVPFERLVEELRVERSLAHSPLFQAIFALQNAPMGDLSLPGLTLHPRFTPSAVAKFDLTFTLSETAEGIAGALVYATALFDATTIDRLLAGFATLLAGAAARPERRLDELPLLSAAERAAVEVEWSGAASPYPREETIPSLFAREAARRPAAIAVVDARSGERWSYGELAARAGRLARRLRRAGVGPEVPVGLFLERSAAAVAAMLAILEAGGAYVPLDPALPPERLAWLLEETFAGSAAPVVVTRRGLLAELPDSIAASAAGGAADRPLAAIAVDDEEDDAADANAGAPPPAPAFPESLAYVTYTSGSTGEPKGVAVVHRAVVRLVRDTGYVRLGEETAILHLAPIAFDASTFEIWGALLNGGRVVVAPPGVPSLAELAALVAGHGVTTMFMTTALFQTAVDDGIEALRPLDQLLVGGEAMSPAHMARARAELAGVRLANVYGPTENTTFTTCGEIDAVAELDAARPVPIGRPIANTRVRLLDAALRPVPIGAAGELHAGGDGLARGYFRRPAATAERFVPDPAGEPGSRLYRTGDLARFLPGGEVDFLARLDAQVKIRGFRIEPGEVESALARHPDVAEAAVVVAGDGGEKRLAAFYVARRDDLGPAELARFLRRKLPEYMVPSAFAALAALPLTPTGKVDRRALAARPLAEPGGGTRQAARRPQSPFENPIAELLASLFASLLGRDEVGVDDDFFALGGHSLLATRVIARLRDALDVELPVAALFERPTPAGLAEAVAEARAAGRQAPPLGRAPRGGDLPLSFAQERLWFIDRLRPGSPAYNLPLALDCDGTLDAATLGRALAGLAARHETLRTRFDLVESGPVQRIDPPPSPLDAPPLPSIDLAALPATEREREAERLIAAESWRPFDLARGPLARVHLLRLAADRHTIVLVLHHSIADGWSFGVLVRDLSALYREALEGGAAGPSGLVELPVQYADYAVWQRGWLAGKVLAGELAYWREKLAGAPPLLALPTDRPRPPLQSWQGAARPAHLGAALSAALLGLGRRTGATPFMVLAAGFLALLGRYSNQEDVTLGVPIAGRTRAETEDLVGFFVNTLVLRAALPGDLAFGRLVERVRADSLAAYEHQEVPFERLVEELRVERSLSHSPLFQAMLALQNAPIGELSLPGLALRPRTAPGAVAKFDLTFTLAEGAEGFAGALVYATALFDATTVDRLLGGFSTLLDVAAAQPERRLDELPLLAAAARHQLAVEWNDTARAAGGDVVARFAAQARTAPGAAAIEEGSRTVSYGELAGWAGAVAARLAALGVGAESRVVVLAERTAATVAGYLGVLAAGGAYVALDPQQPFERLIAMMEDAWQESTAPVGPFQKVLMARRGLAAGFAERLAARGAVLLDPAEVADPAGPAPFAPLAVPAEAAAYVIYTSGSTGRPKGVVVSRGALAHIASLPLATYDLGPGDRSTLLVGTGFDVSVWEIWACLAAGGALVVVDEEARSAPAALVAWMAARRITVSFLPTALSEAMLAEPWPAELALRALLTGGDRLHEGPPAGLPFPVLNLYGPTECTVVSTADTVAAGSLLPSIGRPIGNLRVRLLDAAGRPVPAGVVAELAVGGAGVARGYLGDPARTAERFVPDPIADPIAGRPGERLYRTGDLARFLPDGRLDFLGRRDGQVKIRGIRIELGEIETALAAHPAVAAAVATVRGEGTAARLSAYVVPAAELDGEEPESRESKAGKLDPAELRRWLKDRLPPAMIPSAFVELAALPLSANGKVDRAALPEPEGGARGDFVPPANALEEILAGIWGEILESPRVGSNDSFFDLGGHSLQAVRMMNRIRDELGVELKVRAIFEAQVLSEFANLVAAEIAHALEE